MNKCFAAKALESGGSITPLLIPPELTKGTSLFNPSVFVDGKRVLMNLRHCQYTFYHSEKKKFEHEFGPLLYLNPENDITLTTTNYMCELDPNTYEIISHHKIDTSQFDKKPLWEFIGLEDARVVRWDGKLYICGVRRDTTPHGEGRMELSKLSQENGYKEVSRFRIPTTGKNDTYCEKNWMPILDKPYHFVKWSNPTEVVKVDPNKGTTETIYLGNDFTEHHYRGGGQVIPIGKTGPVWLGTGYYLGITHTVRLFRSEADRKDAIYKHAFILWDKDFNLVKRTQEFSFMNADVEFACGLAEHKGKILITFGFSDNAAFCLAAPKEFILNYIAEDPGA